MPATSLASLHAHAERFRSRGHAVALLLLLIPGSYCVAAQKNPKPPLKPTERVVRQYLDLIASGAELTPEGRKKTAKLFAEWHAEPPDKTIYLMTTGGTLGEDSSDGKQAVVETKWNDSLGYIDSALRYKGLGPPFERSVLTIFQFRLVFTDKHTELGPNGEVLRVSTGLMEWKIADAPRMRFATLEAAAAYVVKMRDATSDPKIKKNAEKTLAILERLGLPCGACAC